ncbi:hypothetical protein [Pseudonocardia sp. DLS-67]
MSESGGSELHVADTVVASLGKAEDRPRFVRSRHEEMATSGRGR